MNKRSAIASNRDLYKQVTQRIKEYRGSEHSLETYLTALRRLLAGQPDLSCDAFASAIEQAYLAPPERASATSLKADMEDAELPEWRQQLARQILDLQEMEADGTLADEYRYYGIDAPSGARWYNFDPHSFVECGLCGAFGGWEPGDDTGRHLVPGKVAVMDADGSIQAVDAQELESTVFGISTLSDEDLCEFFWSGQSYE